MASITSEAERKKDRLSQIEEIRAELHRRMSGQYDPQQLARLVGMSQELDKLVVEVTRGQWAEDRKKENKRS